MALERASEMLRERGSQLPRHIVIQSDNTTRETRNQNLIKWGAHLICSEIFDSITFCFFKVGHTHCEVDQRFSVLAHCLNQCTGLQTPQAGPNSETKFDVRICNLELANSQLLFLFQEFRREINSSMRKVPGRDVECNLLPGAWDFKSWMDPLATTVKGMTITEKEPAVNHCLRIVPRSHLPDYEGHKTWIIEQDGQSIEQKTKSFFVDEFATCVQNLNSDVSIIFDYSNINLQDVVEGTLTQQSRDAILLCKYEMCSKELSQHPQLLLPCARVARLSSQLGPTSALGRNPLSAEEVKQFRKTANMIEQQPWAMHDGSNYLRGLCDRSERADFPTPAPLGLYKIRQHEFGLETLSGPREVEWSDFAPKRPKDIVVTHAKVNENSHMDVEQDAEAERKKRALQQATPQAAKRQREASGPVNPPPAETAAATPVPPEPAAATPVPPEPAAPRKAKAKAGSKAKAKARAEPKAKAKAMAEPGPKAKAKAKAEPKAAAAAPPAPEPQYGCKKCYFKNGCQTCKNFRPGYPKAWRGKSRPGDTVR